MTAGLFTRTYEHWRTVEVSDGLGGTTTELQQIGTLQGRAYATSMTDQVVAGRLGGEVTWTFAAPGDADLQTGDQLRFDGRKLDVKAVSVTSTGRRLQATCEETQ